MLGQPDKERPDKTRLCSSCRMEISVLATKCRYCGASVGRPRDEPRSLTIGDLGGEHFVHYAPSSSVMEALESFRAEETTSDGGTADIQSDSGEDREGEEHSTALPELDERSRALASVALPSQSSVSRYQKAPQKPTWMRKVAYLGAFIAALALGPTGNLRAPAMRLGKTWMIGFNEEAYAERFD